MTAPRVMFDLFCGLKGSSQAFTAAGWNVTTVDIEPMFKPTRLVSVVDFNPGPVRPEFVWASPPCTEFALRRFDKTIVPSLDLVRHAKRVIDQLEPKYWAVENVRNAVPYISEVLGPPKMVVGPFFLWGNFPRFLARPVPGKGQARGPHFLRSAMRAMVPLSLSEDMLAAVAYMLDQEQVASGSPAAGPALEPSSSPAQGPNSAAAQVPA